MSIVMEYVDNNFSVLNEIDGKMVFHSISNLTNYQRLNSDFLNYQKVF
jgi:hypothetical protein